MSWVKPLPLFVVVVAKRGSGKSTLIRDILYGWLRSEEYKNNIARIHLFSYTNEYDREYDLPTSCISNTMDGDILNAIVEEQKKRWKSTNKQKHTIIILDDVSNFSASKKEYRYIFSTACLGRHFGLTCILGCHHIKAEYLPPVVRGNITHLFFTNLPQESLEVVRKLITDPPSEDEFRKIVSKNTTNFYFLVVIDTTQETSLKKYRAKKEVYKIKFGK